VRAAVHLEVPDEPLGDDERLAYLRTLVLDQSVYIGHPGFLAYVCGAGTVPAPVADLLAAGANQNPGGWRIAPGATEIELQCTRWLAAQLGMPDTGGRALRHGWRDGQPDRPEGRARRRAAHCRGARRGPAARGVRLRGGARGDRPRGGHPRARPRRGPDRPRRRRAAHAPRRARRDARGRPRAADGDRRHGRDDHHRRHRSLPELADLAAAHGAWFHVDAAYGGAAVLADDLRPLLAGIERADSLAIDPHKWLYVSTPCGCVLLRDHGRLGPSFAAHGSYIWMAEQARQGLDIAQAGPDFSRGFLALKVWVSLLAHGRAASGRRISHDTALARYLGDLVEAHPDFELLCAPSLSICCFRLVRDGLDDTELDALNQRLMTAVQGDGRVYCSNAVVQGRFGLRACIVNFRTEAEEMEGLLAVAEHAAAL